MATVFLLIINPTEFHRVNNLRKTLTTRFYSFDFERNHEHLYPECTENPHKYPSNVSLTFTKQIYACTYLMHIHNCTHIHNRMHIGAELNCRYVFQGVTATPNSLSRSQDYSSSAGDRKVGRLYYTVKKELYANSKEIYAVI